MNGNFRDAKTNNQNLRTAIKAQIRLEITKKKISELEDRYVEIYPTEKKNKFGKK